MDSYQFDAIKMEKAKAMHRYRTFQKFATILRTLEIFVVIGLISWSLFRSSDFLPAAFNFSGAFLWRLRGLIFCPHFVFLLGNAIIIALFANSREKSSSEQASAGVAFSGEFVSSEKPAAGVSFPGEFVSSEKHAAGDVEEREPEVAKAVVYVPSPPETVTAVCEIPEKIETESIKEEAVVEKIKEEERKIYRRSQSAVEKVIGEEKIELRRSKTVPRRKSRSEEVAMAARRRRMSDVDGLSNEEFRRRVEAFIEKQQKFLREESKAIVLTN